MAVGDDQLPPLLAVPGLRLGTVSVGIKTPGRKDLVLMEAQPGTVAAAVFTRNAFCAAPVTVAREHLAASAGHGGLDLPLDALGIVLVEIRGQDVDGFVLVDEHGSSTRT